MTQFLASEIGIQKVSRRVVDSRSNYSSGQTEGYGFVHISVPHVTLIDGAA